MYNMYVMYNIQTQMNISNDSFGGFFVVRLVVGKVLDEAVCFPS